MKGRTAKRERTGRFFLAHIQLVSFEVIDSQ